MSNIWTTKMKRWYGNKRQEQKTIKCKTMHMNMQISLEPIS